MSAQARSGPVGRGVTERVGRVDPLLAWIGFLLVVMAVGFATWIYQVTNGLGVTNLRNTVMWGQYILFFMFFVGLSAGGLIVASAGRLFGVTRFAPIVRLAVLEATVAVMLAAIFLLPDIGRPERLWHLFRYPNLTSPMIWDIAIVTAYFALSVTYVWLYTRADLAAARSPLALGTGDTPAGRERDDRWKDALAWIALPAAVLLHSITAWIFGLQISRGFWYSAIMAPMFVASALVSGVALVIILALILRRFGRLSFDDGLVSFLGGLLAAFISVEAFLVLAEVLTAAYPGVEFEGDPMARMLTGQFAPLFWFEVSVGLALPFFMLARRSWRASPRMVAAAAGIAIVGIYVHRLNLVLNGLSVAPIGLPPGVSIGTAQNGASFAMSHFYVPSLVEWLIVAGVLAGGALLFTLAVRWLPLRPAGH
ncbi:MAG: polysulfide reductase NrfD [Chloroflexi bacterium]|nr:polysulfide reductase NrfD [Chloroflexota bacterium]